MTTKKIETKTNEYIFRITKTTNLNPFLKLSYLSKTKKLKHIQFRDCIFITSSPYIKSQLMHWTEITDIELADESDVKEAVIKKGMNTTIKYYGDEDNDDLDDDDDSDILEG